MAIEQHDKGLQMPGAVRDVDQGFKQQSEQFPHWEKLKDCVDQYIDLMLNYRQSGHPGGSRSKVHAMLSMLFSGAMRWDIRHPEKPFGDRFALVAGHTAPLVYATLPALAEPFRLMYQRTKDKKYFIPEDRMVWWEDLLTFRRHRGLPGHAEMEGKTLFFKANTGPSGHGSPPAAGQAVALKRAGADGVRVFAFEGEGGLTPGAAHETMNSAYGLGLTNFHYVVDWNDFGIDDNAYSCRPAAPCRWSAASEPRLGGGGVSARGARAVRLGGLGEAAQPHTGGRQDLAGALPGHAEVLPDFPQRMGPAAPQSVAHPHHLPRSRLEAGHRLAQPLERAAGLHAAQRVHRHRIGHALEQGQIAGHAGIVSQRRGRRGLKKLHPLQPKAPFHRQLPKRQR
jgi:transketolase N-terminal domain/subunit